MFLTIAVGEHLVSQLHVSLALEIKSSVFWRLREEVVAV